VEQLPDLASILFSQLEYAKWPVLESGISSGSKFVKKTAPALWCSSRSVSMVHSQLKIDFSNLFEVGIVFP
jgi:hypothetical protein